MTWTRIAIVALCAAAVFAAGFGLAWRLQAGNIDSLKAAHSEATSQGWKSALALYKAGQIRESEAQAQAQAKIEGLRASLATAKAKAREVESASPECKKWLEQPVACPF